MRPLRDLAGWQACLVDNRGAPVHQSDIGLASESLTNRCHEMRMVSIVWIDARHDCATGEGEPAIDGADVPEVPRVPGDTQTRIANPAEHFKRVIGGGVVYRDHLELGRVNLSENTVEAVAEVPRIVEARDDDTDRRWHGSRRRSNA